MARGLFAGSQMQLTQSFELQRLEIESFRPMFCSVCLSLSFVLNTCDHLTGIVKTICHAKKRGKQQLRCSKCRWNESRETKSVLTKTVIF